MKKLMWIICLFAIPVTARAQFEKGKWIVNPPVTGLGLSYSKSEKTQSGLQAQGDVFLMGNVALTPTAGANWSKPEDKYILSVGGRYHFDKCGICLGAGSKMNRYNWRVGGVTDLTFDTETDYAFFLMRTVTIGPAVYHDSGFKDGDLSKFRLKVGSGFYS